MVGKRRSGLANHRRAYGCGVCYTPTPTPEENNNVTILRYSTDQGPSVVWDEYTFIRNTNLPNYSYTAVLTSIPSSAIPSPEEVIGVTISNVVISIGAYAFAECTSLESITIPNSVTSIGNSAFTLCTSLESITIPNSVTSIGVSAFEGCSLLESITIPNSVTSIDESAFFGCSILVSVYISNATAVYLGNQFSPAKAWTSPSTIVTPDFYDAPNNVAFIVPT